jgi:xylose isomerase
MAMSDLRYQKKRRSSAALIKHAENFSLQPTFITRPWTFNRTQGTPELTLAQRLNLAKDLAEYGLRGVELVYPYEINENTINDFQNFVRDSSLVIKSVLLDYSQNPEYVFGALSSPLPAVRRKAIEQLKTMLEINEELETEYSLILLNTDGYNNSFGFDQTAARDRFALGVVEALEYFPEMRIAFHAQPCRNARRPLFYSTAEVLFLCQKIESLITGSDHREIMLDGHSLVTVNPDLQFMPRLGEDPSTTLSLLLEATRLSGVNFGIAPNESYSFFDPYADFSLVKSALYQLKLAGYHGNFCITIESGIIPPEQALKNTIDFLQSQLQFINYLDDDKIIQTHLHPDQNPGWLDAYLIRAASPHVESLPAIDYFQV